MYRDLLADRKVLVVLDDAAGESQVSPLLPGSQAAAVLITSRSRLAALAGATHVDVDVLDAATSLDLLARIAGTGRVQAEARASAEVAGQCGHLPLALRIAGARLAARPHWSIQQLADRLADETRRLDELRYGEIGIRASISLSYDSASEEARRLLRLLALLEAPVFSGWMSAALLDRPLADAEDLLDDLLSARLVQAIGTGSGVRSQYRLHELIRVFARERLAAEEPTANRKAALERALGALLYLAEQAHRRYYGSDTLELLSEAPRWPLTERLTDRLVADPLSWYERERAALVSGVRQAAQAGFTELCWGLASIAVTLFEPMAYLDDWQETHEIALEATRKAGHVRGAAAMSYSMGELHLMRQRFGPALQRFTEAARLFQDAGDDHGLAHASRNIAVIDLLSGRLEDAARRDEQALAVFRQAADNIAAASVLQHLARVRAVQREFGAASELLAEALRLSRIAGGGRAEVFVLQAMGETDLQVGEPARAAATFELVLAQVRELGDPIGEAQALLGLGIARLRQGESGPARDALQRARQLADTAGNRLVAARALLGLSELTLSSGDPGQAAALGQQAVRAFRAMEAPLYEARALSMLRDADAAPGDGTAAFSDP